MLLTTCTSLSAAEMPLQRVEAGLEHVLGDAVDEVLLDLGRAVELGAPLDEGPVADRDRRQAQRRDIVLSGIGDSRIV